MHARSTSLRSTPAALLLSAATIATVVAAPAPPASAQPGYRICTLYDAVPTDHLGDGLVVKVALTDAPGYRTCQTKVAFMRQHYGEYYSGLAGDRTELGIPCESFTYRASGVPGDRCAELKTNVIYAFNTRYDQFAPTAGLVFRFAHL